MQDRNRRGPGRATTLRAHCLAGTALAGTALAAALAAGAAGPAWGETKPRPGAASPQRLLAQAGEARAFTIPPQPLGAALITFGRQVGLQVAYPAEAVAGLASPGVSGTFTPAEALRRLLAGTGLVFRFTGSATVTISRPGPPSTHTGATTLLPVTVQGANDPARTEGTHSYTSPVTTIGRGVVPIREIPQSISVITRQRIEDQNMTTMYDAMRYAPGITISRANEGYGILSRGFGIGAITVDGMVESLGGARTGAIDLAPYDRVEILRGPAGLFNGTGQSLSGSINLARKRALNVFQMTGSASIGSWNTFRGEADVTGPLNASKTIRGRLVAAGQDRDWFMDTYHDRRGLLYGTLEFDLDKATTLSVGSIYQRQRFTPFFGLGNLPRGRLPNLPRSTYNGTDWARSTLERTDVFADLEHRFANGGFAKISGRYSYRTNDYRAADVGSSTNLVGTLSATWFDNTYEDTSFDGYVSMPFQVLGQQQNILIGANYNRYFTTVVTRFGPTLGQQNLYNPIYAWPNPSDDQYSLARSSKSVATQYGVYGQVRLKPLRWATFVLGGRLSSYDTSSFDRLTGITSAKYAVINTPTPYAGLVIDLNETFSVYGSYTSTFQPQSAVNYKGELLPPIEGNQYEAGITGTFFNKTLNTRIAWFRLLRENSSLADPDHPGFSISSGLIRSQGFEAEISGRVLPGWDIAASYAYTETRYLKAPVTQQGLTYATSTPKHLFKAWTRYTFQAGTLKGFSLGGGVRMQSSIYAQSGNFRWRQTGYAIFDAQIGYRFTKNFEATLSATNLLDTTYFETVGSSPNHDTYFGEPRRITLTMRVKF
jgi:outer membrane receptor for ferric coprogen and ferric-rhodotorulic acid